MCSGDEVLLQIDVNDAEHAGADYLMDELLRAAHRAPPSDN